MTQSYSSLVGFLQVPKVTRFPIIPSLGPSPVPTDTPQGRTRPPLYLCFTSCKDLLPSRIYYLALKQGLTTPFLRARLKSAHISRFKNLPQIFFKLSLCDQLIFRKKNQKTKNQLSLYTSVPILKSQGKKKKRESKFGKCWQSSQ